MQKPIFIVVLFFSFFSWSALTMSKEIKLFCFRIPSYMPQQKSLVFVRTTVNNNDFLLLREGERTTFKSSRAAKQQGLDTGHIKKIMMSASKKFRKMKKGKTVLLYSNVSIKAAEQSPLKKRCIGQKL